jgi:hypothetical protein
MTNAKQQNSALQLTKRSSKEYANKCTVMPNLPNNLVNPSEATPGQAC